MKKILATGLVSVSSALVVVLVSACSAPMEEEAAETSNAGVLVGGPGIWQLNRECGTKETGACGNIAACGEATIGDECVSGARCLTAPSASGLRQVLLCNPTSSSTWTYNGDCANDDCRNRPDCDKGVNAGDRCRFPLKRCGKGGRVLVCLTDGKDQYAFSGYCGKNGGPACASLPACPRDEDGMAGLSCANVGAACQNKIDKLSGKIFTCISR